MARAGRARLAGVWGARHILSAHLLVRPRYGQGGAWEKASGLQKFLFASSLKM